MKALLALTLLALAACAPLAPLEPFAERRPDPIADQAAHRAPVEWWYFNGHLETAGGPKGFAAAIFQVLVPPEVRFGVLPLQALFPEPIYFGHVSVVDKNSGEFRFAELSTVSLSSGRPTGVVGSASRERMDVRLGDWRATREPDGTYTLRAVLDGTPLDLRLAPERPEVVHGPGWSGTPQTGRMYYYSATRLRASGTLAGQPANGLAWFDHQWGGQGGDGSSSITPSWDWLSLQLDDGRDLMVYLVRDRAGKIADRYVSVTSGGGEASSSRDFTLSPWRFAKVKSGATYPVGWFLKLADGTALTVRAVADDQELTTFSSAGIPYYEGAVNVTGSVRGVGYMELTGYGASRGNPFENPLGLFGSAGR